MFPARVTSPLNDCNQETPSVGTATNMPYLQLLRGYFALEQSVD